MRIPEPVWKRSVWKQFRRRRENVRPAESGLFYSMLCPQGNEELLTSSGLLEPDDGLLPYLRELILAGGEPFGISGVMQIPPDTPEETVRELSRGLEQECERYRLEIMQMEPRILTAVTAPFLTVTVFARAVPDSEAGGRPDSPAEFAALPRIKRADAGQDIVMAGWAGLAGTIRLIRQYGTALESYFPGHFLRKTEALEEKRLPVREARLAAGCGVTAAQAAGEGGIFDAFWRLGESTGRGMELDPYRIPIRQETIEITGYFDMNPYQIRSDGAVLFVTDQGKLLCDRLREAGLAAAVVGTIRDGKDRYLNFREERRYLEPFRTEPQPGGKWNEWEKRRG